jgi:hypothetical protein
MSENTKPLVEVLIEIGKAREAILARMKAALQTMAIETVAECAALLCGFKKKKRRNMQPWPASKAAQSSNHSAARRFKGTKPARNIQVLSVNFKQFKDAILFSVFQIAAE